MWLFPAENQTLASPSRYSLRHRAFVPSVDNVLDPANVRLASKNLLASLRELLRNLQDWTKKSATEAEVAVFIIDTPYRELPRPPFSLEETDAIAAKVFDFVRQRNAGTPDSISASTSSHHLENVSLLP